MVDIKLGSQRTLLIEVILQNGIRTTDKVLNDCGKEAKHAKRSVRYHQ